MTHPGFGVHVKDVETKALYERFDFLASPTDPCHMFRLLKDIRAALERTATEPARLKA